MKYHFSPVEKKIDQTTLIENLVTLTLIQFFNILMEYIHGDNIYIIIPGEKIAKIQHTL